AGQVKHLRCAEMRVIAEFPLHTQGTCPGKEPLVTKGEVLGLIVKKGMAARLRFQRQRESAVGVDVDPFDGVHLDSDGKAHGHSSSKAEGSLRLERIIID